MSTLPLNTIEDADAQALAAESPINAVMLVSSATAQRWLELNKRNRPISAMTVERYRRDMAEGRWVYAADPIRFDTNGNLLDGQHRLTALAMCEGVTIPLLVIRGLPADSQLVMDQGRKRTPAHQLALKGVRNATSIAAGVKIYIVWSEGLMFRDSHQQSLVTTPQIEAWVDENKELCDYISSFLNAIRQNDAPPSVGVAAAFRFAQIDPVAAKDFFQALSQGGSPVGHPINTLDKRLQRQRREGLKMSQRDYLALFFIAWNAWRDNKKITKFQRPRGGSWTAETFPEPK